MFIEELKKSGAIDHMSFSISIAKDGQSQMTFGGYQESIYATGPISWHNISQYSNYWSVGFEEFSYKIGNKTVQVKPDVEVIVDSGTSYILMPSIQRKRLIRDIQDVTGTNCYFQKQVYICECFFNEYD